MAKGPDRPRAPQARNPAKHSKKDPAKPTRAKAARPDTPALDPSLAELLNPGIAQGRAGIGAQTGSSSPQRGEQRRVTDAPAGERPHEASGLEPPPDNSWDRRADFAQAHRARASVARGFAEPPQQGYVGRTPVSPGQPDPDVARALGIEEEEQSPAEDERGGAIKYGEETTSRPRFARPRGEEGGVSAFGSAASQQSLERLLREGRPEFREHLWTPHRPPRPDKSEGGFRLTIKSDFDPKGDQPQAIRELVEGVRRNDRSQVLLGVTGSGKTFTMAKVVEETQR